MIPKLKHDVYIFLIDEEIICHLLVSLSIILNMYGFYIFVLFINLNLSYVFMDIFIC